MKRVTLLKELLRKDLTLEKKFELVQHNKRICKTRKMKDDLPIIKVVAFARRELRHFLRHKEGFSMDNWYKSIVEKGLQR